MPLYSVVYLLSHCCRWWLLCWFIWETITAWPSRTFSLSLCGHLTANLTTWRCLSAVVHCNHSSCL